MLTAGLVACAAPAADIIGPAAVVDGDGIFVDGVEIRLGGGIDAFELGQTCRNRDGTIWHCGAVATYAMAQLIRGHMITCRPTGTSYDRVVAVCVRDDGVDLAEAMIAQGRAVAWERYGTEYIPAQAAAKAAKRGAWAGTFDWPWVWRRRKN